MSCESSWDSVIQGAAKRGPRKRGPAPHCSRKCSSPQRLQKDILMCVTRSLATPGSSGDRGHPQPRDTGKKHQQCHEATARLRALEPRGQMLVDPAGKCHGTRPPTLALTQQTEAPTMLTTWLRGCTESILCPRTTLSMCSKDGVEGYAKRYAFVSRGLKASATCELLLLRSRTVLSNR